MNDIIKPVGQWISANIPLSVGIGIFIFCLFFEISKVKVYPLRWLWKAISWPFRKIDEQRTQSFKKIVESMKTDLDKKLEEMQVASNNNCDTVKGCLSTLEQRFTDLEGRFDSLDDMQKQNEEKIDSLAASRIKNHVLNFARQCRKGEPHSHEDFANLFKENKIYQELVKHYGWENDVYVHDFAYIKRVYDEHNNKGDFLE